MLARQSNKVLRSTARVASITKVNPSALRSTFSSSSRSEYSNESARNSTFWTFAATGVVATGLALSQVNDEQVVRADNTAVNWDAVRKDIVAILDNEKYDDGSYGPVIVRLAWHACGTYCNKTHTGGSDGATMRFAPESDHGANAGLDVARALLEFVKARHPGISYSDLWQFAAVVAIEEMGGPKIPFHPGRVDKDATGCTPDGRLPDAAQAEGHLRDIFYRMGFNDQEIVALSGAHALGRCHTSRSGFDGPWTKAPTMFSNEYFRELLENDWTLRKWSGPKQYTDPSGALMMLPTDMSLIQDPKFKVWVEKYKADEELFFKDFAKAFQKLQENGVKALAKPWYQFW